MIEQYLIIIGSVIFGILGLIHLLFTFTTKKFNAVDKNVTKGMKLTSLVLTNETTMWNAWIGFNASHSLGAMLVTAFYTPLALTNMEIIRENLWFSFLPVIIGISYLILAKKYWFKIPYIGILISTLLFIIATVLINT